MSPSSPERTHLSIREVLEVLVEEFPDVTISKIRFLESRGLIHPERTPAGYRRFYQSDVERLRWILQQQREHFLPLKVIKGRLERDTPFEPSLFDVADEQDAGGDCTDSFAVAGVGASLGVRSAELRTSARGPAGAGAGVGVGVVESHAAALATHGAPIGAAVGGVAAFANGGLHAVGIGAARGDLTANGVVARSIVGATAALEARGDDRSERTAGTSGERRRPPEVPPPAVRQPSPALGGDPGPTTREAGTPRPAVGATSRRSAQPAPPVSPPDRAVADGEPSADHEAPEVAPDAGGSAGGGRRGVATPAVPGSQRAATPRPAAPAAHLAAPGTPRTGSGPARPAGASAAPPGEAAPPAAGTASVPPATQPADVTPAARDQAPSGAARGIHRVVTGASFSSEELAVAAGVAPTLIDELLEYGLIAGREVAGVRVYDEDALLVARVAGAFRRFGIEGRHLKSLRHAAEREAGLYAQVVTPLLRQRNPHSHERAVAELQEMCELGASLSAHFVQAELRQLTGG